MDELNDPEFVGVYLEDRWADPAIFDLDDYNSLGGCRGGGRG